MSRKNKKALSHSKISTPKTLPALINRNIPGQRIVCEFDGRYAPKTWPAVSLCMIVKNEEQHLAACLESVGDFASEIIIVDTGSTDRTVEIAESFGAKIRHFPWIDDFAAARNESVKDASGEWIFWMDADDRLTPRDLTRLKQAVVSGQADAYMGRVISHGPQQGSTDASVEHLRLFRNHLGLYFEFPLHETVLDIALKKGLKIALTNIVIEHTGYQTTLEGYQVKARRNLVIINRCLEKEPGSLYWRFHRAAAMTILEDNEQAIADYEAVIIQPPIGLNSEIYGYQAHTSLLNIYHNLGQIDQARRVLALTLERFPHRRHLAILAGHFHLLQDELDDALTQLQRAKTLSVHSDFLGQSWPSGRLEWVLGQVYLFAGEIPKARSVYRAMLSEMKRQVKSSPSSELTRAQTLFETGDYPAVYDLLESSAPGNLPALRLLAQSEHNRQNWRNAAAFLAQAIALSGPQPGEWVRLAEFLVRTHRFASAERLCRLALAEKDQNAEAYNWLGFIAMQRGEADHALVYLIRAKLTDPTHLQTQENLAQLATALNLPLIEMLRQHGLWMIQQRQYTDAVEALSLVIEGLPNDVEAYKFLAVALNGLGRQDDAFMIWQASQQMTGLPVA